MVNLLGHLSDLSILIAFLAALLKWRALPGAVRLMAAQVLLSAAAEIWGWYLVKNHQSNTWIYNCYFLLDTVLLTLMGYQLTQRSFIRKAILVLLGIYLVAWTAFILYYKISVLANFPFLFECTLLTAVFLQLLVQWYQQEGNVFLRNPLIILCLSTIIYYGCNIPLFGTLNYLNKNYPLAAEKLYSINYVLNVIRYLAIAYGFMMFHQAKPADAKNALQ